MSELSEFTDATLATASAKWGMGGGTATSIFGCLSDNEMLVIAGIVTTIFGFVLNAYFQYKRDQRATEEHRLRKKVLELQIQEATETHANKESSSR